MTEMMCLESTSVAWTTVFILFTLITLVGTLWILCHVWYFHILIVTYHKKKDRSKCLLLLRQRKVVQWDQKIYSHLSGQSCLLRCSHWFQIHQVALKRLRLPFCESSFVKCLFVLNTVSVYCRAPRRSRLQRISKFLKKILNIGIY